MPTKLGFLLACLSLLIVAGCAKQSAVNTNEPIKIKADNQTIVSAAEEVLTDMHFVIDKADADAGYVLTKPLAGQEWFEFWRSDAADSKSLAKSSLFSLQKTAELSILQIDSDTCQLECVVYVQKLNIPQRQISGFGDLPSIFSKSSPSRQKLELSKINKSDTQWIDLADDELLAFNIKQKISKEIARK